MRNLFVMMLLLITVSSCSPKLGSTWMAPNYTDRSFQKIAVVAITENLEARQDFEQTAVKLLAKQGINAVGSMNIFPPNMSPKDDTPENIIKILKDNQLDGVITIGMLDESESERYEHGESLGYVTYYRVGDHIIANYNRIETPGYYVATKNYLIEAVFHNVKGELTPGQETIVWRGQSTLRDPNSIGGAAKSFTTQMVNAMIEGQVVK